MTVNNFFGHLDQKRCQKRDFCSGGAYGMLNVNCMHLSPPNSNRDNNAVSVLLIWLLLLMKLQWYFGQTFNIHFQHSEFALWHIVIYSKCVSIKRKSLWNCDFLLIYSYIFYLKQSPVSFSRELKSRDRMIFLISLLAIMTDASTGSRPSYHPQCVIDNLQEWIIFKTNQSLRVSKNHLYIVNGSYLFSYPQSTVGTKSLA